MDALDDIEYEGNVLYLLNKGLDFVRKHNNKKWRKDKVYRIEYPDYPERAVQEALVNALVHRDYTIRGSEIHLGIYDDRIEIYSPGGMYDGTYIQNHDVYNIASIRRNPTIANLFEKMRLMERRGSGLKGMIEIYQKEENYKEELKPSFRSTQSSFFTTLKNLNFENQKSTSKKSRSEKMIDRQNEILKYIKQEPYISISELSRKLKVSENTITRDLDKLLNEGYIKYDGETSARKRIVIKEKNDK